MLTVNWLISRLENKLNWIIIQLSCESSPNVRAKNIHIRYTFFRREKSTRWTFKCGLNSLRLVEFYLFLTHWGRVTHVCVSKLTNIVSDNGLSPGRRQAIIWTNAGILLIGPLGTNSSEILIGIRTFWLKKMRLKVSSAKWRPFCLGLNVLNR